MTRRERCEMFWRTNFSSRADLDGWSDDLITDTLETFARSLVGTWTEEKPTTPGWYFWRPQDGYKEGVREVIRTPMGICTQLVDFFDYELRGQWAGPICEPKEQPCE